MNSEPVPALTSPEKPITGGDDGLSQVASSRIGLKEAFGYALLFIVSFVLFFYLSFPYEVLKETVAKELKKATGVGITMGKLGPSLPLGLTAQKLTIETLSGSTKFKELSVDVSILGLLLGRISAEIELTQMDGGQLVAKSGVKIWPLISESRVVPTDFRLDASQFDFGEIIRFGLNSYAGSPEANPTFAPLLGKIGVEGKMDAKAKFSLDTSDATQSDGTLDLKFSQFALLLADPALDLPDQRFEKSQIIARLSGGSLKIEPTSGFEASELAVNFGGKIQLRPVLTESQLDLKVDVQLKAALKDQFGFVLDAVPPSASRNGELTIVLKGTVAEPSSTPL